MGKKSEWKCIGEKFFDGDVIITDPCYLKRNNSWEYVENFCEVTGLISGTFYGDWGCTVYKTNEKIGNVNDECEEIGNFCADAGMVCVLTLERALLLDPDFEKWIDDHSWCVTRINNFRGDIRLMTLTEKRKLNTQKGCVEYEDTELRVRGDGNVDGESMSFESVQTSM